jgi:hypothetical protein
MQHFAEHDEGEAAVTRAVAVIGRQVPSPVKAARKRDIATLHSVTGSVSRTTLRLASWERRLAARTLVRDPPVLLGLIFCKRWRSPSPDVPDIDRDERARTSAR